VAATRRLAAIMFTDIVGFTASAQSNEADALRTLGEQEDLVRPLFRIHQGREIKSTGDGFLVEFDSALHAVQCAIGIQQQIQARNARPGVTRVQLRIGVHLGDVEERDGDIFGDAVNIASRIPALAPPGGVCLSGEVFNQVRNKIPNTLEKLEPQMLKNVRFPLDLYRVVLGSAGHGTDPGLPVLPRIAVLPLVNISPDPKDEYFADGLTEELISVLSQIRGIRVIARTSVSQYKGTTKPVAQIGAELGVSSILEGSVRKVDNQLRISVQLIDARSEEHRWAMTYDRKLENVFAIQADVAERTAQALKVELVASERAAIQERPTSNLAAYESYLRGIEAFQRSTGFGSEEADKEAVKYFEEAIREDPQFSGAYSSLASHLIGAMGITRPGKEVFPRARELVVRALELNPSSSDAHTALGNLAMQMDLDWARAESEFREAIALNPSASTAHFWYGFLLGVLQRYEEAKRQYLTAVELDPLWPVARLNLAATYAASGDYGSAIAMLEKMDQSSPGNPGIRTALAVYYTNSGRTGDAIQAIEFLKGATDLFPRASRSGILALLGRPEESRALMADLDAGKFEEYAPPLMRAFFFAAWGEKEKALALLERDYREGDRLLWNSYQFELLDPIRSDPRFVAMLRAMNLPTDPPRRRATIPERAKA
jgi:adenylate cyclase